MTLQTGDLHNIAAVRHTFDRWIAAVQSRDRDGVVAQHTSDVVMFDVPMPPSINGLNAYRETWAPFFRWFGEKGVFEPSDLTITAGDEVAFSHCLIRCEGSQGEGSYLPVRLTLCYQKVDGQWLIAHEHHSVPFEASDD
jgi:uncharacterized protein (TIGR02246 family)